MKEWLFILLFSGLLMGCIEDSITGPPFEKCLYFEIPAWDYSDNHFFVDTIYANRNSLNIFSKYYHNAVPYLISYYRIKKIEVWRSHTGLLSPDERRANSFVDLKARAKDGYKAEKEIFSNTISGKQNLDGRCIKLEENDDYIINRNVGLISFINPLEDTRLVAVSYTIEGPSSSNLDDIQYGDFISDINLPSEERLVLKLVKDYDINSSDKSLWNKRLKNIYRLPINTFEPGDLEINICMLKDEKMVDEITIENKKVALNTLFGVDLTDETYTSSEPDGKFDFLPGKTFFPETGDIIFPALEPFGKDLPAELPITYKNNKIYNSAKYQVQSQTNRFFIRCKYKVAGNHLTKF